MTHTADTYVRLEIPPMLGPFLEALGACLDVRVTVTVRPMRPYYTVSDVELRGPAEGIAKIQEALVRSLELRKLQSQRDAR